MGEFKPGICAATDTSLYCYAPDVPVEAPRVKREPSPEPEDGANLVLLPVPIGNGPTGSVPTEGLPIPKWLLLGGEGTTLTPISSTTVTGRSDTLVARAKKGTVIIIIIIVVQ